MPADDEPNRDDADQTVYNLMYRLAGAIAARMDHTTSVDVEAYCGIYEISVRVRRIGS